MLVHLRPPLTSALLVVFSTVPAWAQTEDTFTLNASYARQSDSNLFRLPSNANVNALIGKSSAAEEIAISSVGFNINKAYSLQRLELAANLVDNQYQNFSYLNFIAHNYNAAWRWSLTPHVTGNLTSERKETLNSFADFQGYTQSNQRTNTSTRFDAAYELYKTWSLLAGATQSSQTNQRAVLGNDDFKSTASDLGLRFAYASGSALSYSFKTTDGTYLNRTLPLTGLSDDGFRQIDHGVNLLWVISGKSQANLSATQVRRTHPHFAQLDFSGLTTSVNLNWNLSGKSALTAGWARELSSYQTSNTSYTQTDRFSVGPIWQISPKTSLRLRHEVAQLDFFGSPAGVLATQRSDTTRDTSLSFDWQPHKHLALSAALQNVSRASSLPGFDFDSRIATVSAQFTY